MNDPNYNLYADKIMKLLMLAGVGPDSIVANGAAYSSLGFVRYDGFTLTSTGIFPNILDATIALLEERKKFDNAVTSENGNIGA